MCEAISSFTLLYAGIHLFFTKFWFFAVGYQGAPLGPFTLYIGGISLSCFVQYILDGLKDSRRRLASERYR
jgi:hypothetical protein